MGSWPRTGAAWRLGRHPVDAFIAATGLPNDRARSQLAKFGLGAEAAIRPQSSLSPGERTRAELAAFAARGVNFLVLDEPTNHLDLPAIEQLESALDGYGGTLAPVSHDRRLLEKVRVTRTITLAARRTTFRGLREEHGCIRVGAAGSDRPSKRDRRPVATVESCALCGARQAAAGRVR